MGVHCNDFGTGLRLRKVWDEKQQHKSRENPLGRADLDCRKLLILVSVGGKGWGSWELGQPMDGSSKGLSTEFPK